MIILIDLHIHTNNSDGDFTSEEILKEAEKEKLEIIAIADHNNISAYKDLKKLDIENIFSGKIITGTELEFAKDGKLYDMLGYGFNLDLLSNTEIIKAGMIHSTIEGQTKILKYLMQVCEKIGIIYSKDLVIENANNMANDVILDNILTFDENKEILNKMGIYDRTSFYRQHFCEPKSPFYIDETKGKQDIFYVTRVIHEAGGLAFLAHPYVYKLPNLKEFLDEIVSYGIIDGIECEHRKHSPEEIKWLKKYCDDHKLLKSGGSDKHTKNHFLGYSNNNNRVIQSSLVEEWIDKIEPFYEYKK